MAGLKLTVWGRPIAQARARFRVRKSKAGKSFAWAYNPQETEAGKFANQVANKLPAGFVPFSGALALSIRFIVPIPASGSKKKRTAQIMGEIKPTKKPDLDNYVKFVKDCLNGVVWLDDSQVVEYREPFAKVYGEMPRTEIEVVQIGG